MIIYRDIINAILTQKTLHAVAKFIKPHYFNGQGNTRLIYDYIRGHYKEYQEIPEVSMVKARFEDFEYEERFGNINEYIKIIQRDVYHREYMDNVRKMVLFGDELRNNTMSTKEVHRMSLSLMSDVAQMVNTESNTIDIGKNSSEYMEKYYEKQNGIGGGIPTYIPELDDHYVRFVPGHLIYVFARPGAGKTWSIIHMAKEMWKNGFKPLILSYEMSEDEVDDRAVCLEARVNYSRLSAGVLTQHELIRVQKVKNEWKASGRDSFLVVNPVGEDTDFIESKIVETNPDAVFIDYIHLIANKDKFTSKIEAVEEKSKDLKQIAKRRKVPMIVISHSNRDFARYAKEQELKEQRDQNFLPQLENIADADGCGKDADMVIGLHGVKDKEEGSSKKTVHMGVVKGRFCEECQTTIDMDIRRGEFIPKPSEKSRSLNPEEENKEIDNRTEEEKIIAECDQENFGVANGADRPIDEILENRSRDGSLSVDDCKEIELDMSVIDDIQGIN